jgi:hypothetical protein
MTTFARIFLAIVLVATPLSGEVFAQSASSTATGSTTPVQESQAGTKWFRSERIEGNIDVGDFVVGPGRAEITVSPGETVVQEITVTNRISDGRTFNLAVEDITGSSDGNTSVSLTGAERGPYSIRDYVSFPEKTFRLDLGERARIPVRITIPADAEPGGYYGSVLVSTDRNSVSDQENVSRSPVIARIGSLLFVRVRGNAEIGGQTKNIKTTDGKWWYEKGPVNLSISYENTGVVHVNPYSEVSIKNMFGEEVGYVELEPWFVLPKSLRSRDFTWDREFLFGRYTVTATVHRGYDDQTDVVKTSFWVLPWKIVIGVFAVFFILIFGIRAFFRTFEFSRKKK